MTSHPSDDHLELYTLRRLSRPENEALEDHLLVCDPCRTRSVEAADFATAMRDALKTEPAQMESRWFGWLRINFALAAAFAGLVLAITLYWTTGNTRLAPVATLQLTAMRGSDVATAAPAGELDITLTDAGDASKAEIVGSGGTAVWSGVRTSPIVVRKLLRPGDYLLRAYLPSGQLLHEYAFRIKK